MMHGPINTNFFKGIYVYFFSDQGFRHFSALQLTCESLQKQAFQTKERNNKRKFLSSKRPHLDGKLGVNLEVFIARRHLSCYDRLLFA